MSNQLTPADFHEIQYRSDSTNLDALSSFAKMAATDRRELLDHIESRERAFKEALQASYQWDDADAYRADQAIEAIAAKLNITLD